MAALVVALVVQLNEGVQSGAEVEILRVLAGETDAELLARKAASHESHGWTVEWTGAEAFHAWKVYGNHADHPSRVDRYFRLSEG